jgi:aryl-alcohol dehydrogenase-like predicted oxidoreductase
MPTRRNLLQIAVGALLGAASRAVLGADKQAGGAPPGNVPKGTYKVDAHSRVQMRELGKTGVRVSIIGLGGYHLGLPRDEQEAIGMIHKALDHGLNFMDNCWDYNNGRSEERLGKALQGGYREKAFVMTKLDGRTAQAARGQLDQSLRRLKIERIDLVQIHEVIRPDDPERCFAKGGVIEALIEARRAGKLRMIGFTGHKDPSIHRHMIEVAVKNGFQFDTVQMPLNVLDAHYRSFEKEVVPLAVQNGIGVLGMKPLGAGLILKSGAATAEECLRYAMSVPDVSVTITGCESEGVLDQALWFAITFMPMDDDERQKLLARTAPLAQNGKWERFKTTHEFDGTVQHKKWLTTAEL